MIHSVFNLVILPYFVIRLIEFFGSRFVTCRGKKNFFNEKFSCIVLSNLKFPRTFLEKLENSGYFFSEIVCKPT